jgi:diaminohydroxyphosphoribosylaminopyrimidine deaminase/5-amino-6-(5-phosphoribosylamino)uracil reductase
MVHGWRSEADAIAVGIGTALADDPLLSARHAGARQPLRIVFDSRARLPLDSQLLATLDQAPVIVVTAPAADPARLDALRSTGAEILVAGGETSSDRVLSALTQLGRREVTSVFLEGGRTLAAAFAEADQLDESRTFVAPILLGGGAGGSAPTGRLTALDSHAEAVGEDTLITARFREW